MCLGRLYFEKNQKNATLACSSVPKQTYIFSIAGNVLPLVFYKMQDQGSS